MRKQKLISDYNYDFDLLGITSSVKDYKLAWAINKKLSIKLARNTDHEIQFQDKSFIFSYYFDEPLPGVRLRLFANKNIPGEQGVKFILVPEAAHFDYIFMREGESQSFSINSLQNLLKDVPAIEYLSAINISKIKHKEFFVF